jgi:hypothetical protein
MSDGHNLVNSEWYKSFKIAIRYSCRKVNASSGRTKSKAFNKGSVHFETKNEIIRHTMPSRVQLSSRDKLNLRWTCDESEMMIPRTRMIIESYKEREEYIRQFIIHCVFHVVCSKSRRFPRESIR